MAEFTCELLELRLDANGLGGRITCPAALRPAPGQYLLASAPEAGDILSTALFPLAHDETALDVAAPLPPNWSAGMILRVRGPLGAGFRLPPAARRVGLCALEGSPERLLPLARLALEQSAGVVLVSASVPDHLPQAVEVLPPDQLAELWAWADFVALQAGVELLENSPASRLGAAVDRLRACDAQVLALTPLACGGTAECGVCAVSTTRGWKRACADGPVFDLNLFL